LCEPGLSGEKGADAVILKPALRKKLTKWGFLLPCLAFMMLMAVFPLVWSLSLSFTKWLGTIMARPQWNGLKNFRDILFNDPRFWADFLFTIRFVALAVLLELSIGLGLAHLLHEPFRGRGFFRVLFLIPMACPPIAVAFIWKMMVHPDVGVINSMITSVGLARVKWTTSTVVAPFTIVMVDVWEWTPFMFLALLAAYQALPEEIYQAAAVDGASKGQMFRRITLPLISPLILTISLIRIIDAFKLFELVFGITSAGPANSTEALSFYIYLTGIKWFDLGKGAAMSWIFLLILLSISMFLLSRFRRRD
jgi:multiple sugar transport system permease protein